MDNDHRRIEPSIDDAPPPGGPLPAGLPVLRSVWQSLDLTVEPDRTALIRRLVIRATRRLELGGFSATDLMAAAVMQDVLRAVLGRFVSQHRTRFDAAVFATDAASPITHDTLSARFVETHLVEPHRGDEGPDLGEVVLLRLACTNPALVALKPLFDDEQLSKAGYVQWVHTFQTTLDEGTVGPEESLFERLLAPRRAAPDSIHAQLAWVSDHWRELLPAGLVARLVLVGDIHREEQAFRGGGPGPAQVLEFRSDGHSRSDAEREVERFSADRDWMADVVLMARSTWVWLDQLSKRYGRAITRLDQIPDAELDELAARGFTGLWLIGLWERSPASAEIKRRSGNPEAMSSAYSLDDYRIAEALGGDTAWHDLSERAGRRGVRLAADMVPNHFGLDSRWVVDHPERFLQLSELPYPGYTFDGPDLCADPAVSVHLEDGYWDQSDAAVVFRRTDHQTGQVRYIYHGNDGTHMPWNDTAQLDYLRPETREAVIRTIVDVARRFPIIRFDAAMTLARRHVRRLWYPPAGQGGAIPSRAGRGVTDAEFDRLMPKEFWREVVDRVAAEAPDTLLLAEAFWLMEGYFVRTLGMHRVYNSAFMNMLKTEDNAGYRQTIKNVLEFSPGVLGRFVNFQNNPDEEPAIEQFGDSDKYFGVCTMMVTLPGLPMFGHGQVEGFTEKYGMEYRRAYRDETPRADLIARHEREIFPLVRRRHLFSQSHEFALYDLQGDGGVVESVFAYSNRAGDDPRDRAVVLYNNRWERADGWIHRSAPANVASGEATDLRTRTITEALALPTGPHDLVAFQEQRSGQWFLRRADALERDGLHVSLSGYECQILWNFRFIPAATRSWMDLCASLDGSGCPDLDAAQDDILRAPTLQALEAALREGLDELTDDPETAPMSAGSRTRRQGERIVALATAARAFPALETLSERQVTGVASRVLGDEASGFLTAALAGADDVTTLLGRAERALGVNTHDGVRWYRAEAMAPVVAVVAAQWGEDAADALAEADSAAAYRFDALLDALRPASQPADSSAAVGGTSPSQASDTAMPDPATTRTAATRTAETRTAATRTAETRTAATRTAETRTTETDTEEPDA